MIRSGCTMEAAFTGISTTSAVGMMVGIIGTFVPDSGVAGAEQKEFGVEDVSSRIKSAALMIRRQTGQLPQMDSHSKPHEVHS